MRSLKLLLLPLLLALLAGMIPPAAAAQSPTQPDYACADEIFDRIYGRLNGRKAASDETARADSVEQVLAWADGVEPGSVRRIGNDLTWRTQDGVACRFSSYLDSLASGMSPAPAEEPARKSAVPEALDVCLFAPYYGLDDAFEGPGGIYDSWGETLAHFTGGQYHRYERSEATIDAIADAVESCAVVLIDSHGDRDPEGVSSFICLQSGRGLTARDYAVDPETGASHTYYVRYSDEMYFFEVDGTVIADHMDKPAAGGLFWSGTCYGMATDGLCAPLLDKGVGAVYGYSKDVTFGGDSCWMVTFMDELTKGGTVARAASEMKRAWGAWDCSPQICAYNNWSSGLISHTAADAKRRGEAFPVVVSAEDPFPADPDAVQTVRSDWRLPRQDFILHFELPDGVKCPDIRGFVFYSGRLPTPAGKPRSQEHSFSFAGWSLEPFPDALQIPVTLFRPGETFRFGYSDPDPLSFGDSSATLFGVYSYLEDGKTWYTTQVPDGEYDPYDPSAMFSDMAFGTWYYQDVRDSVAMGLIKGYNDGTFRPDASIRRSEVVTILHRAAGSPAAQGRADFPDVPSGCFYEQALAWATENGIVLGYNDGRFHPDAPVTRAQLAALFCRFAGAGGADPSSLDPFPDRAAVPGWAEAPLAWAVEQELIKGTRVDGRLYLQPTGQATRAQFVTIMQRYLSTATKEETQ